MVGVEEGREFRFRGDLYSQESTFPLVYCFIGYISALTYYLLLLLLFFLTLDRYVFDGV